MSDRRVNDIPDGEFGSDGDGKPPIALILAVVIGVFAVIFVVQNSGPITTEFLWIDVETRQWVTILIAIVLGVVLDRLFALWWRRSRNRDDE